MYKPLFLLDQHCCPSGAPDTLPNMRGLSSSSSQCSLRSPTALVKQNPSHYLNSRRRLHCSILTQMAPAAPAAAGNPVLVHDGEAVPAPVTAQLLLTQHKEASYTTALAQQGHLVIDWELHLQRLLRNAALLGQVRPPTYAQFIAHLNNQHLENNSAAAAAALDAVIRPHVAQALHLLAAADQQQHQQQAMVTVVITDPQSSSQRQSGGLPLSVLVWAKQLPAATSPSPAKVIVSGGPRDLAQAKHCAWVLQRQPLEQLKQQAGVDEVLLTDSSGGLLEGLVSNFFVIAEEAALALTHHQEAAAAAAGSADLAAKSICDGCQELSASSASPSSSSSSSTNGLVLLTAGPDNKALPGVMQARVLQACQQLQLKVLQQPARPEQRHAWREAFLTNCVKGIQPVASVQLPDGTVWQAPDLGGSSVTQLLRRVVTQLQSTTDMSL